MGGVDFKYLVQPRSIPVTTFQDALTAGTTFYIGPNWDVGITFDSGSLVGTILDQAVNTGGSGMTFGGNAAGAPGTAIAYPIPVDNRSILAKSLTNGGYVQARFKARAAAGNAALGLTAMSSPGSIGYSLNIQSLDAGVAQLLRYNGSLSAGTTLDATLMNYVANDVLRMECRNVGATVEIKTFKNGVLNKTTVDNSVNRITSGLSGIMFLACQAILGTSMTIDNYDGGAL